MKYLYNIVIFLFLSITLLAQEADNPSKKTSKDVLTIDSLFSRKNGLKDSIEVLANGDTIIHYYYDAFDFGAVNTKKPKLSKPKDLYRKGGIKMTVRSFNSNNSVGNIAFTEGMTPSGGKTYAIPIMSAPVVSLSPQIALAYNSQASNGVAGYGWNISGLSVITLSGKNKYYDNQTKPIDINHPLSNSFLLNGTRLVTHGGEYQYETAQGFILVKRHMYGNHIAYFTARYPNGNKVTFGFVNNTTTRLTYPVTSIEDIKGYRIDFEYNQSENQYYVSKIRYGGKSKNAHVASINFTYVDRNDYVEKYISGKTIKQKKLLKKIESYNGSDKLRSYNLTHSLSNQVNQLTQLDCSTTNAQPLNPLLFSYKDSEMIPDQGTLQEMSSTLLSSYFSSSSDNMLIYRRGKFVKNKFNDGLITYPGKYSTYGMVKKSVWGTHYQYGSLYPEDQSILIAPGLSFYSQTKTILAEKGFQTIAVADVDGDGVDEFVKVNFKDVSHGKIPLKITVYSIKNGNNITNYSFTIPLSGICEDGGMHSPISRNYLWGDFNGDGRIELLSISHNKNFKNENCTSYFDLIDLKTGSLIKEKENVFSHGIDEGQYLQAIDINGDGKTELCRATSSGYEVYVFENNKFIKKNTYSGVTKSTFSYYKKTLWGDLNGDGKPDLLVSPNNSHYHHMNLQVPVWSPRYCPNCNIEYPIDIYSHECRSCLTYIEEQEECIECHDVLSSGNPSSCPTHNTSVSKTFIEHVDNGNEWRVYYATGKGFVSKSFNLFNSYPDDQYLLMDIDHDGLADLLQKKDSQVKLYLNEKGIINNTLKGSLNNLPVSSDLLAANLMEYNRMSHFICIEDAVVKCYNYTHNQQERNLLASLTDSYGVVYHNEYENMLSNGNYISTNTNYSYPYSSFIGDMWLLRTTSKHKDYQNISNFYFSYWGAVLHRTGLGFSGFEKIKTIDHINNVTTIVEKNPLIMGVTKKVSSSLSEVNYQYYKNQGSNKRMNPRITQLTQKDKLKNITVTKKYQYDVYNNPTKETVTFSDNCKTIETFQSYDNLNNASYYLIGQPFIKTVKTTKDGLVWQEQERITYYNNRLPQSKELYKYNGNVGHLAETTVWEYDSNGNVVVEKTKPFNTSHFEVRSFSYDSSGRYLATSTDELGLITYFTNYDKYGHATAVTDFRGHTTSYQYDAWGNLQQSNTPNGIGIQTTSHVEWGGAGLFKVTKTTTGRPTVVTHYDALNREVRISNQRFDGQWQHTDKQYDNRGRLQKVSLPFRGNAATYWNNYEYDNHNRLIKIAEPSGRSTLWQYSNNTVVQTKNGITTTKTYDAAGNLIIASDAGGTIAYQLRPDGQPLSITAGGVTTSFAYDVYGRQTQINDPSAGTQSYSNTYVNSALVYTHTNAKGEVITTKYDKHGRVKTIERPEFNTIYTYDASGLLTKEVSTNGTGRYLSYDGYGRLHSEKSVGADGTYLTKTYSYSNGNIATIHYNIDGDSDTATEYYYYNYGYNTEIKLNGVTSIWKLTEENDLGQPHKAVTGNLQRTYNYTAYGMPTRRKVGNIQDFSYEFDPIKGNLKKRTDNTRNKTEVFGYDNLNRLSAINGQQITYADNGNIMELPGIGSMEYNHPGKPYALTALTPTGDAVPLRDQQITYTSFMRPATIVENGVNTTFTYNAQGNRVFTSTEDQYMDAYYYNIDNKYEARLGDVFGWKKILYLGGDAYSAPVALVSPEMDLPWELYYICRDYLGSITHIVKADGTLEQELSYGAWAD